MIEALLPGLILMVGALFIPLLPQGKLRGAYMLLLPVLGLAHMWLLPDGYAQHTTLWGLDMYLVRVDGLSRIFGTIFHLAAFLSVLYALHVKDPVQQVAALMYSGSAIGAAFAGDLPTLFLYWEATAITSVFLIWARHTHRSYTVGLRYLIIQVLSGVLLLAGTIILYKETGSIAFERMQLGSTGTWLIFLAFGIKAAFPLLHNWLQDSYPEATATGTVWLSAFTTKLAIYALARGFAGTEILIPIGATMAAFPVFFAVIENDLRRVLAYSLNNQLGFMIVGIGIGTPLALNGTATHAFAHIIYKALLFMGMGAVLYRTGTTKANELGGLYKTMPWTTAFTIVGALSISAFPLFSGFVTKSMILVAAAEEHHTIAYLVLLFASAGVLHHSGIKIPFFAFFADDSGKRPKEAPWNMLLAMGLSAALCIGIGAFPGPLYRLLPFHMEEPFSAYTTTHVVTQAQLLIWAAIAFVFLRRTHLEPDEIDAIHLDTDWTYRKLAPAVVRFTWRQGRLLRESVELTAGRALDATLGWVRKNATPPTGILGEPWPTGATALWAAIALSVWLVLYYVR